LKQRTLIFDFFQLYKWWWSYRSVSIYGGAEEFCGDLTFGPRPKFWNRGQRWKK